MNIEEIKDRKKLLEYQIKELINEFEEKTAVKIENIYLNKDIWHLANGREIIKNEVSVEINL